MVDGVEVEDVLEGVVGKENFVGLYIGNVYCCVEIVDYCDEVFMCLFEFDVGLFWFGDVVY